MRTLASSLVSLALITSATAPLAAQHLADSATVGRWFGHAELTVPWTARRTLEVRLDIQPDGGVSGTIGDALLADAHIYRDSRFARALRLARAYAIDGRLVGAIIRSEGVMRERVHLSIDCAVERMTGDLQTSGTYDGPVSDRLLTARVTLERVGAVVAMRRTGSPAAEAPHTAVGRGACVVRRPHPVTRVSARNMRNPYTHAG